MPPPLELVPLVADGEDLALVLGLGPAFAEVLETLGLEPVGAAEAAEAVFQDARAPLHVWQVRPAVEGAGGHEGAKEDEEQALLLGRAVADVDGIDDQHGQDGAGLASSGRDAVAGAAVARGKDLGREDERERVGAWGLEEEGKAKDGAYQS